MNDKHHVRLKLNHVSIAEGSFDYCRGYKAAWEHCSPEKGMLYIASDKCRCGPDRVTVIEAQRGFKNRTGCLTCNNWDGPPRPKSP